jgi:hypothetical protein
MHTTTEYISIRDYFLMQFCTLLMNQNHTQIAYPPQYHIPLIKSSKNMTKRRSKITTCIYMHVEYLSLMLSLSFIFISSSIVL